MKRHLFSLLFAVIMLCALVTAANAEGTHECTLLMVNPGYPATCTTPGRMEFYSCGECGGNWLDYGHSIPVTDLTIPALGHSTTLVPGTPATCTAAGKLDSYVCANCGGVFLDAAATTPAGDLTIAMLPHATVLVPETAATCTAAGTREHYTCTGCSQNFQDAAGTTPAGDLTIAKLEHTWVKVDAVPATCTSTGTAEYYYCSNSCSTYSAFNGPTRYEFTNLSTWRTTTGLLPAAHQMTCIAAVPATCTAPGVRAYYTCSACGGNFEDAAGAAAIADLAAWRTGAGMIAAAHNPVVTAAVPATCTTAGVKAYYTCSSCGQNFEDAACSVVIADLNAWKIGAGRIPSAGHNVIAVSAVAPTCTTNGINAYFSCTTCGKYYTDAAATVQIANLNAWILAEGCIPALGHQWGPYVSYQAATCTRNASNIAVCQRPGCTARNIVSVVGTRLEHWYDEWTPCGNGVQNASCKRCTYVLRNSCEWYTFKLDGNTYTVCPVCGQTSTDDRLTMVKSATATGSLPAGEITVRTGDVALTPQAGSETVTLMSVCFEYGGRVTQPQSTITVTIPASIVKDATLTMIAPNGTETPVTATITGSLAKLSLRFPNDGSLPVCLIRITPNAAPAQG